MDDDLQMWEKRKWLAVAITALALAALAVSSYLTWVTWQQSTVAGCTGGSLADCDEVLSSSGSKWLGIPVSLLGALTYAALLAVVWPAVLRGGWLMTALLTLAMMAAGGGVWFIANQAFLLQHFCMYCMAVHVCGLVICMLTIFLLRAVPREGSVDHMRSFFAAEAVPAIGGDTSSLLQPVIAAGIASVGLVALIVGQVFFAPSGMEVIEDLPMQVVADDTSEERGSTTPEEDQPTTAATEDSNLASQNDEVEPSKQLDLEPAADVAHDASDEADAIGEIATKESANDVTATDLFDEPVAASTDQESSEEEEAPRPLEIIEPEGEAVVVSDEEESGNIAGADTVAKQPSIGGGISDIGTATTGKTFEELFGPDPLEFGSDQGAATVSGVTQAEAVTGAVPSVFRLNRLQREIDVEANPVLGNPYAPRRLVEMLDYTCPHCRKLHPFIKAAVDRYGDQLGFVIYHVPLSRKCNQLVKMDQTSHNYACDYARLAYGVWKLAPEQFPAFHDWLMTGERVPAIYEAKRKAMALAGSEVLTEKSIEIESSRLVGDHAADLEPLKTGLPVLIFDGGVIRGLPGSEREWFQMLEQRMGLTPVTTARLN